ncbi:MAG: hypothetical protein KDC38_04680, partial [Planctomycetes bacterium]|nr:hypothetical protein [Planctomycetota bacterium]
DFEARPTAQWIEERRRRERSSAVSTLRALRARQSDSGEPFEVGLYAGDGRALDGADGVRVAATPGYVWTLKGSDRPPVRWWPQLLLAFEEITPRSGEALSPLLSRIAPQDIRIEPLPTGQLGSWLEYRLQRVGAVPESEAFADLPARLVDLARIREDELTHRQRLWQLWDESESRPDDLDLRSIRVRLEFGLDERDRPVIEERLEEVGDLGELEELLHLLFVLDPASFDNWYRSVRESADLARLLAGISVRSLRDADPARVLASIDDLLGDDALFAGRSDEERLEVRTWLEGVRLWTQSSIELDALRTERSPSRFSGWRG